MLSIPRVTKKKNDNINYYGKNGNIAYYGKNSDINNHGKMVI